MVWYGMVWYGMVASCYMFGYMCVCWDMFVYVWVFWGTLGSVVICSMLNENRLVNFTKSRVMFGNNLSLMLKAV